MKCGAALLKAKCPSSAHVVLTRISEVAAYGGIALYILLCLRERETWKDPWNLTYSTVIFTLYLMLPVVR